MHMFPLIQTYVAVDDLQFRLCEPSEECQTDTDFQCADGNCIPRQYYCDAKYDCVDKSDEYQCPSIKVSVNEIRYGIHLQVKFL